MKADLYWLAEYDVCQPQPREGLTPTVREGAQ